MDRIHLLLLLSGLCSLSSCLILYEFFQDAKTWDEARSFCRERRGDLVTMYNLEQMQTALETVGGQFGQGVWIGLHKGEIKSWHWSLALKDFYKEGERDNFKWESESLEYNCGTFRNGIFQVTNCGYAFYAVCFDVTKQGLQQYILSSGRMIWQKAREHCRSQYTDLVSVRNEKESQMLQEVVGDLRVNIGLFRDPWVWSYGSKSSFRYWKSSIAVYTDINVRQCVTVREDGRWEQHNCNQQHSFLCSYEKTYVHFYKVKISSKESSLDLNDPKVTENILKHLKQQLNGTGVEGVRWKTQPDGRVFQKEEPKKQEGSDCRL